MSPDQMDAEPSAGKAGSAGTTSLAAGRSGAAAGGESGAAAAGAGRAAQAGGAAAQSGSAGVAPVDNTGTGTHEYVYVSGYGPNIHVLELDTGTGTLQELSTVSGGMSPSYMAFSPDKRCAYAINEAAGNDSKVLAFRVDPQNGQLSALNSQTTNGSGAPHLAVHPSGQWLVVAHYTSGEVSVLPIGNDGTLGSASQPDRGPQNDCKNAHQAVFDETGDHLLVPCLGSDYVLQYIFDAGVLKYNDPPQVAVKGGPRHLALDPTETHAYVLSEYASTITWFDYDKATGTLTNPQTINSYAEQAGSSAHIVVHPSGGFLYASNRKENSLGLFGIDAAGRPSPVAFETDMLSTPRDFSVDPTGQWLILANQDGDQSVLVYKIASDGKLSRTESLPTNDQPTFTKALILP